MASIRKRERGDGTVAYQVLYRQHKQQHSITYGNEKAAKKARAAIEAGLDPRKLFDRDVIESPTVADLLTMHIAQLTGVRARTRHDYKRQTERHIHPHLGDLPVVGVTDDNIADWINALDGTMADKTLANLHGLLSAAFETAKRRDMRDDNPCRGRKLPRTGDHEREEMVIFTHGQYTRLEALIDDHWRPFVGFLAATGCRFSEATALAVSEVAENAVMVNILRAHNRQPDSSMTIGPTKTRRSRRTVAIPVEFQPIMIKGIEGRALDDLVFTTPDGNAVEHGNFRNRVWRPAITAMTVCDKHLDEHRKSTKPGKPALAPPCGCPGYMTRRARIHDLRHTHASWLLSDGAGLQHVQRRLGHESITTTVDTYGHLLPDVAQAVADSLTGIWAAPDEAKAIEAELVDDESEEQDD